MVERDANGHWRIARAVWNANQPGALAFLLVFAG